MKDHYKKLIIGASIAELIERGYLARAELYARNVSLKSLKLGINGDYTVKSSDAFYGNTGMLNQLKDTYEEIAAGTKTLIFNNGISTSKYVYETFKKAGYPVRHLDNKNTASERREILSWFAETPDAILTSVSILTTGFDEPSVETIILNRATRSLTLYFQMIGRGSRVVGNKNTFKVIDMGNNIARFGPWDSPMNWQDIFHFPDYYLENIKNDEDIERDFSYEMPPQLKARFAKSKTLTFDIKAAYKEVFNRGLKSKTVLENSIDQHATLCYENAKDIYEARMLIKLLQEDISYRVKTYSYCIMNNTKNYKEWLEEDYQRKLRLKLAQLFSKQ
jgi:type I site-specific restriction endonuclease